MMQSQATRQKKLFKAICIAVSILELTSQILGWQCYGNDSIYTIYPFRTQSCAYTMLKTITCSDKQLALYGQQGQSLSVGKCPALTTYGCEKVNSWINVLIVSLIWPLTIIGLAILVAGAYYGLKTGCYKGRKFCFIMGIGSDIVTVIMLLVTSSNISDETEISTNSTVAIKYLIIGIFRAITLPLLIYIYRYSFSIYLSRHGVQPQLQQQQICVPQMQMQQQYIPVGVPLQQGWNQEKEIQPPQYYVPIQATQQVL